MPRVLVLVLVTTWLACDSKPSPAPPPVPVPSPQPAMQPPPKLDLDHVKSRVRAELLAMNASDTSALIPGTRPRELGSMPPSVLPYSNGRSLMVPIVLIPATLRVPTELGLRFMVGVDSTGALSILDRPTRTDLATATQLALDGEGRALEVAVAALDRAGEKPPGPSWAAALRTARLDPRLPVQQFAGQRSWHLMFDPWTVGGWRSVIIGLPGFDIVMVNGKRP